MADKAHLADGIPFSAPSWTPASSRQSDQRFVTNAFLIGSIYLDRVPMFSLHTCAPKVRLEPPIVVRSSRCVFLSPEAESYLAVIISSSCQPDPTNCFGLWLTVECFGFVLGPTSCLNCQTGDSRGLQDRCYRLADLTESPARWSLACPRGTLRRSAIVLSCHVGPGLVAGSP